MNLTTWLTRHTVHTQTGRSHNLSTAVTPGVPLEGIREKLQEKKEMVSFVYGGSN